MVVVVVVLVIVIVDGAVLVRSTYKFTVFTGLFTVFTGLGRKGMASATAPCVLKFCHLQRCYLGSK